MHIEKDVDLYSYSTMRTHNRCDVMYFPENTDELISLLKQFCRCFYRKERSKSCCRSD